MSEINKFASPETDTDLQQKDFVDEVCHENDRIDGDSLLPKIGLINIMSSQVYLKTEHQWRDALVGRAEIVPLIFDEDPRLLSRPRLAKYASPVSSVADRLDGLIVTGANLERYEDGSEFPIEGINYHRQLNEVIDWSIENNRVSIFSCLASHIALKYVFDIDRTIQSAKTFGVFDHELNVSSDLGASVGVLKIRSPHSRWGNVSTEDILDNEIKIVADNGESGWLLAESSIADNRIIFIQGHPEYQRDDLRSEYLRDRMQLPENYFKHNNPNFVPEYSWADDSAKLFRAIGSIVSRQDVL